jgi:hypothetical protein
MLGFAARFLFNTSSAINELCRALVCRWLIEIDIGDTYMANLTLALQFDEANFFGI